MDTGKFVFGSQYLRGMTPFREDWRKDMAAMGGLGFNTIRAWLVWGVLEPQEGQVDVGQIRDFLDLAHEHNLKVGLLFHLYGCPEWAIRKYRRYWYVDGKGRRFEPAARPNTPSGGWPGLCFDHLEVQKLETAFIQSVAHAVGDHPALSFWEPVNEPHQWIDLAQSPPGVFCYCRGTRAVFVRWLQEKYGTLENLNRAWGRRLGQWDEARPPTWRFGFSDWCDWRTFTAENIAAMVRRRTEIIRACSKRPVIAHAWGGSCITCTELGSMAFDDWKNSQGLDGWGDSAFPQSPSSTVLVGLGTAATRSAAEGRPFWQAELGVADYHAGLSRSGRLPAKWLEMWSWESIRQGAKGLLYWQFRKERQGLESGAYGLTGYGGGMTDNARAVERIGKVLTENSALFSQARLPPARVAILFSYQSYMMEWSQFRNCRMSVDSLAGYYRMLWEKSIPADILHEERITAENLGGYRMLILPMPVALAKEARDAIKKFIEDGGTVLSDPYLCAYDPTKTLDTVVPGDGFSEIFGCRELDIAQAGKNSVGLEWAGGSGTVERSHFQAFWEPSAGSEILARYSDKRPAIIANRWGRGRAVISGLNLGMAHAPQEGLGDDVIRKGAVVAGSCAKQIVLAVASQAGVTAPLSAPDGIVATLLKSPEGEAVLIAINTTPESCSGEIRLEGEVYSSCIDLMDGNRQQFKDCILSMELDSYQTRIFKIC